MKKEVNYAKIEAKNLNVWTRLYQCYALYFLFKITLEFFYRIKYLGHENIDRSKSYIVAPNHISYLDVFLASIGFRGPVSYMAKKELFECSNWLAVNMRRLGAFAVNREKPEISTFKSVKEVFKTNFSLGIFPQGGIKRNKKLEKINKGIVIFAKKFQKDILPIGLSGLEEYNWNPLKPRHVKVQICKPISYGLPEDEIIERWCREISEATGYEYCEEDLIKA